MKNLYPFHLMLAACTLLTAASCRDNISGTDATGVCRVHITVSENLAQKDSGAIYLCSQAAVLDTMKLRDTTFTLAADTMDCKALFWEFPGINAGVDRYFVQFIPESGTVTINLDSAVVEGGPLNREMEAFSKRVSDAVGDYDCDYARDICADTFRKNPRNAIGLRALQFCFGDFSRDEVETMMKEAGLSRKERKKLMENLIIR